MENKVRKKIDDFFSKAKTINYKKGETLIRAEDPIIWIFYLKKGYVRQYSLTKDGQETTIHIFRPSSYFPMMIVVTKGDNPFNFEALSDVEVKRESVVKVLEFVKSEPDVLFDLAARFARGVIGLSLRVENLSFENAYKRLILFMLYLGSRFNVPSKQKTKHVVIDIRLTHSHIASWIGTSRETTSKQIEKLAKAGAVGKNGHAIVIKNIQKLEKELLGL
ncbi:MAG: Crp/Fnr family transcriptional regulator [Candidatus Levybacteria bacterium]|nr:Crp/Fnr family transcriptional regulator [Candidatus Levybacteria bacterium]